MPFAPKLPTIAQNPSFCPGVTEKSEKVFNGYVFCAEVVEGEKTTVEQKSLGVLQVVPIKQRGGNKVSYWDL